MPTTRWTATGETTGEDAFVIATEFHLSRMRDTPAFLRATREITSALDEAEGLIGYALQARILSRTYRTVSAWRSPEDARGYARSGAHGRIAAAARSGAQPKALVRWHAPAGELPPSWTEIDERLRGVAPYRPAGVGSGAV